MRSARSQAGFTLVEMLVAVAVATVVLGAVVGLLTSSQTVFRREPEVADMQQNLRAALDIVMRDVAAAGSGLPAAFTRPGTTIADFQGTSVQVFSFGLDDGGGCDDAAATGCPRPLRPASTTERTDDLTLFLTTSECGAEGVCGYQGGNASHIRTDNNTSCVRTGDVPLFFMADGTWTIREVVSTFDNNGGPGTCANGTQHADVSFRRGGSTTGINASGGLCDDDENVVGTVFGQSSCEPVFMLGGGEVITYRVTTGTDGVPNLERRSSAQLSGSWQGSFTVIARGIEDLQVQYATAGQPNVWLDEPPDTRGGNVATLVTAVRVTLSGRTSTGTAITGTSRDVRGGTFVRASLTSTAAVRSGLQFASGQTVGALRAWN